MKSSQDLQTLPSSSDIEGLIKYLIILAEEYPTPISQKQLARKAKVTMPAVSKIRERVQAICEPRLGFKRELVLRRDSQTVALLFQTFFFTGEIVPFLESGYGKSLWQTWVLDIHHQIRKAVPQYAEFFEDEDALFVADLVVRALVDSIGRIDMSTISRWDSNGVQYAILMHLINVMNKIGKNLQRHLKDEQSLKRILVIRDRAWFMCMGLIKEHLARVFSGILETLEYESEKELYLAVYSRTLTFYLARNVFGYINSQIKKSAEREGVKFEDGFEEIGRFFAPEGWEKATDSGKTLAPSTPPSKFLGTGKMRQEKARA